MKTKWTPGPWERDWEQDGEYTGPGDNPPGYAGDYYETNSVGHLDRESGYWEPVADCYGDANTVLIAQAPAMYEELDRIVKLLEPFEQSGQLNIAGIATLNGPRAVLAKARGEAA